MSFIVYEKSLKNSLTWKYDKLPKSERDILSILPIKCSRKQLIYSCIDLVRTIDERAKADFRTTAFST